MEKIDKDNMYRSIWDFPENIFEAIGIGESINLKNKYSDINKIMWLEWEDLQLVVMWSTR